MFEQYQYEPNDTLNQDTDPGYGCLGYFLGMIIGIVIIIICSFLTSCTTTRESTSTIDRHNVETLMHRMDSFFVARNVTQYDSTWHQLIMRQFQSLQERNDTSHTLVVDTAGRVIKETLIIRTERESASETDRNEREVIIHQLSVIDSTLAVMQKKVQHTETLLQQNNKTEIKEVSKPLTWWQNFRLWLGNLILVFSAIAVFIWIWRKRSWWLRLFK